MLSLCEYPTIHFLSLFSRFTNPKWKLIILFSSLRTLVELEELDFEQLSDSLKQDSKPLVSLNFSLLDLTRSPLKVESMPPWET